MIAYACPRVSTIIGIINTFKWFDKKTFKEVKQPMPGIYWIVATEDGRRYDEERSVIKYMLFAKWINDNDK